MRARPGLLAPLLALAAAGALWIASAPSPLSADAVDGLTGDAARGERVFLLAGCASCHAAAGAEDDARLVLAGGRRFETPFGTFVAPNVSPHPERGIGGWSARDLANAMLRGVSPEGAHYYPAFPYTSYARMDPQDVVDLKAYLDTLPPSERASEPHDVSFPFNVRRGLGLWKLLHLDDGPIAALDGAGDRAVAGRALVEGAGHCGQCHTPRGATGGLETERWMAGAPNPAGEGRTPNLTPGDGGLGGWSAGDIAYYLESGFTPDFDSAGGAMVEVIENTSRLPAADREAIAAYLKALPPLPEG